MSIFANSLNLILAKISLLKRFPVSEWAEISNINKRTPKRYPIKITALIIIIFFEWLGIFGA